MENTTTGLGYDFTVDNDHPQLPDAMGIPKERADEIQTQIIDLLSENHKNPLLTTELLKRIGSFCNNPVELAYSVFMTTAAATIAQTDPLMGLMGLFSKMGKR